MNLRPPLDKELRQLKLLLYKYYHRNYLARQYFPDGVNMLSMLHRDNFIKKQPTSEIIITYGLSDAGRIQLDELNKMIAKEKGVKVSELAEQNASSEDLADEKKETKKDAKKTSKKN